MEVRETSEMVKGMRYDAIKVDWRRATKILEDLVDEKCYGERSDMRYTFEDRLHAVELLYKVNRLHQIDDINGYFDLLDNNRDLMIRA